MNTISKNRSISVLIIVLLLANITTLSLYWLNKEKKMPPPRNGEKGGGNLFQFITHELNFDSVQQAAYTKLIQEDRINNKDRREQNRIAKEAFFDLLSKDNVSDDNLKKAAAVSLNISIENDMHTFRHFQKVRSLCTAEQKKKFDEIIKQAIGMMRQQGPPPNGKDGQPPHDGPPPGGDGQRHPPPDGEKPPQ